MKILISSLLKLMKNNHAQMVNTKPQTNEIRYKNIHKWFYEYKKKTGCQMCGWNEHPEVLEAHHKIPLRRKNRQLESSFLGSGKSIQSLEQSASSKATKNYLKLLLNFLIM